MLFVESEKVYVLRKRHASDTLALCARRAFRSCRQGDGIYCRSLAEVSTVKKVSYGHEVPVIMRKQERGGWIVYPLFYKSNSPRYKAEYDEKRKNLRKKKNNESEKDGRPDEAS